MSNRCTGVDLQRLEFKIVKPDKKIDYSAEGIPLDYKSGNPISGDDLACWMSTKLSTRMTNINPPTDTSSKEPSYNSMYDSTLLAGLTWAMLGSALLYYTVTSSQ